MALIPEMSARSRIDQAVFKLPIGERILADTDTLMVFGLRTAFF